MTKCFLTDKTYPDYEPTDADQRQDFQRELYKAIGSWGDFVNNEQTNLAVECAKLIINLNNNNPDAFKTVLSAINMMVKGMQDKSATEGMTLPFYEVMDEGEGVYVTEENGDVRYSDWAQDILNLSGRFVLVDKDRYEYHIAESYFEPDDVCRNGKPIADCQCC